MEAQGAHTGDSQREFDGDSQREFDGDSKSTHRYAKLYTDRIHSLKMSVGYQPPKFQYFDSKGNPKQHVTHFIETCNNVGTYDDHLVEQFVRSMNSNAFDWYTNFKANSIDNLLLGPPSSGKTTLLLALAGRLDPTQIVNMLREYVQIMKGTAFISLLQPAPETFDLFDDIVLLSDGKIVYQGPRENVLDFFESMGFKCPHRKAVADFRFITVTEFAKAFESHILGRSVVDDLDVPYDKSKTHPAALTIQKYGLGKTELLKACANRELLWLKRNSFVYFFRFFQITFMAILVMTMFFRTKMPKDDMEDGGLYTGALIFAVMTIMFNGCSEIPFAITTLPVFYKQRNMFFFPAWAFAIPEEDEDEGGGSVEANKNSKRGMVLPFEPHSITFEDIRYLVDMPQL